MPTCLASGREVTSYPDRFVPGTARKALPLPHSSQGSLPMPYSAEISRTNPTCFLFLVDQSSSMLEPFGAQPDKQKAEGVADAINRLLQNLVLKSAKSEGIRDFFHVGIIGYGAKIELALGGGLAGHAL